MKNKILYFSRRSMPSLILFFLSFSHCFSQITILQFPTDNQIFQRDDNNYASVAVSALVSPYDRGKLTLKIWQETTLHGETEVVLTGQTRVNLDLKIKAGQYNYSVKLYFNNQEIKKAERIAGGDVYLIYGQSNAMGYNGINDYAPAKNVFLRYYVMDNYEGKEGAWMVPFETSRWAGIGLFPLELERVLFEKYRYPVGVIVAAVGGANILSLNSRNQQNPTDIQTYYGQMLTQLIANGQKDQIKYLIFRHGESDASDSGLSQTYPEQFSKLMNYFKTDLPGLKKIYNFQNNILTTPNSKAAFLREFQRNSSQVSSLITNISTVGTKGYDGLHYNTEGYRQTASELARILGKEVYGAGNNPEIYSPDLKNAYWQDGQVVLEFDEAMKMAYDHDTTLNGQLWQIKDFLYIDGKTGIVNSVSCKENRVYLGVTVKGTTVSYLPSFYGNSSKAPSFYNGTHLKNSLGMRAFSFENVKIQSQRIETDVSSGPTAVYTSTGLKCAGASTELFFTSGKIDSTKKFIVQLSEKNGTFVSDKVIGEGNTSPITVTVPEDTPPGTGYRMRLVADYKTNNLLTDSFTVSAKATVMISTKKPEINQGEEAGITLSFTGVPPFDFMLSDSSRHSTSNNEIVLMVKPQKSTTYSVLDLKNSCGAGKAEGKADIQVKIIVLANEPLSAEAVRVFPNPAIDYFNITINSKAGAELQIFDASGKKIIENQFYEHHKISTGNLAAGTYYYRLKNGKSVNTGKIIIQ